jgi:hypothetical protein
MIENQYNPSEKISSDSASITSETLATTDSPLPQPLTQRAADILTGIFLTLLPFVFFWRETLGKLTLGDRDAIFWFLPIYKTIADQVSSGHLPLWNPYMYGGMPLFANLGAATLDPLNWIYLVTGVSSRALTFVQQITFSISLAGMYGYARTLRWKRRACVMAAIIYGFNGFAVARVIYPGLLHIYALSPLIFFFLENIYQCHLKNSKTAWRKAAAGSLIVAWQILAGHPQPFIYCSLVAAAYALFCCFLRGDDAPVSSRVRFLTQCSLMYLLGVLLSAVQLLPAIEFSHESVRSTWDYEAFTAHSLNPVTLLVTLFPFFHGGGRGIYQNPFQGNYWHHNEAQIYLGLIALALSLSGMFMAFRRKFRVGQFWMMVAAICLLLSMGGYLPFIARLIYQVPLLGNFRSPNRYWMEVVFALSILTGYAINELLNLSDKSFPEARKRHVVRVVSIVTVMLLLICCVTGIAGVLPDGRAEFIVPVFAAAGGAGVIFIFVRRQNSEWSYGLLLLGMLADLNFYAAFAPINSIPEAGKSFGSAITRQEMHKNGVQDKWRYHLWLTQASGEFDPHGFYGHEMVAGYDPLLSARYKTFSGIDEAGRSYRESLLSPDNRTLDLLNVKYLLIPESQQSAVSAAMTAGSGENKRWCSVPDKEEFGPSKVKVFENKGSRPRAWIVHQIEAWHEGDQLKIITGEKRQADGERFDPEKTALLLPSDAGMMPSELLHRRSTEDLFSIVGQSRVLQYDGNHPASIVAEIEIPVTGLLILSELDYPGWKASIDDSDSRIFRVNYFLRGIVIPAGTHHVTLRYQPRLLMVGAIISGAGAVLIFLISLISWMAGKKSRIRNISRNP